MADPTADSSSTVITKSSYLGSCAFTDKLPVEIRIRIYKDVLTCKYSLVLAHHEYPNETRFNVSLLTTCKSIYAESSDILLEVNTVLLWRRNELSKAVAQEQRFLHFVRCLELVNLDIPAWLPADIGELHNVLDVCLALPRLKSLTIAGDVKGDQLFSYLESAFGAGNVHCIDIGYVRIEIGKRQPLHIKHYGIAKALQELSTAQKTVKLSRDWSEYREEARKAGLYALRRDYVRDCDLQTFCFLVDLMRRALQRLSMETASFVLDFKARLTWKGDTYKSLAELVADSRLKHVLLRKHDAHTCRLLTEALLDFATIFPNIVAV